MRRKMPALLDRTDDVIEQRNFAVASMIVKAEGPSGPAKIRSDDPKRALGLVQYLRTIGYEAWIEDTNGNGIEERVLKMAIKSTTKSPAPELGHPRHVDDGIQCLPSS